MARLKVFPQRAQERESGKSHKTSWGKDVSASLVVFLVALPLCMGIAIASGVSPVKGLVTGVIGGLVVGALSGSPLQVSGPAAGLAVIIFELVREHGMAALAPVLMLAGVMQLVAGMLKTGRFFRAISPEVIHGMLAGIGVLIVIQQFHVVLDRTPKASGPKNIVAMGEAVFGGLFPLNGSAEEWAALVGVTTIAVMLLWEKLRPASMKLIPGALLGIAAGTALAQGMHLGVKRVSVPSNLGEMVTLPTWSSFSMHGFGEMSWSAMLTAALALAFIASAETLLSAAAVEAMQTRVRTDYDKELAAQGVGNLLCGVLGALPMTGVIVRSSANVHAGAESRRSTMLHGVWIVLTLSALPFVLRMVPMASLAGVLLVVGVKLVKPSDVLRLKRFGWAPVAVYLASLITIVATNLLTGVMVGVGLSLLSLLWRVTHVEARLEEQEGEAQVHLAGVGTFFSIPKIASVLDAIDAAAPVRIHTAELRFIDHSVLELIESWVERRQQNGGVVVVEMEQLHRRFVTPVSRVA
ncbi:MAG: SulP family inorganic anion transporter [Acidobacteriaceae bacterium]|nr:SulP family inorganic anion transporter [Acidobacteriaceae bacterium]